MKKKNISLNDSDKQILKRNITTTINDLQKLDDIIFTNQLINEDYGYILSSIENNLKQISSIFKNKH